MSLWISTRKRARGPAAATLAVLACALAEAPRADAQPPADSPVPEPDAKTVAYFRKLESLVAGVSHRVMPAVVAVQSGRLTGSGVVISPEGHVLTVAHAVGRLDAPVILFFPNGSRAHGKVLEIADGVDAAVVKITTPGRWPHVAVGGEPPTVGDWCLGLGHTDGYKPGRTPPVRLGRIVQVKPGVIQSDCILDTGDSGGPLFDLTGRVIAIHDAKVGQFFNSLHTPIAVYRARWRQLLDVDGPPPGR